MRRLCACNPDDYFRKLFGCRTSMNGVFGIKVHFPHFETAISWYPSMIELLSPAVYIHLQRRDKLAQAVSMAKAIQTDAWQSLDSKVSTRPAYDERLIAQCLREIDRQNFGWRRWFEIKKVKPFVVYYEDLLVDSVGVVRHVIKLLDVETDKPDKVVLPVLYRQADGINTEWIDRFRRERDHRMELDGDYGALEMGCIS